MTSWKWALSTAMLLASWSPLAAQGVIEAACRVKPVMFNGWSGQELSNQYVKLTVIPQLGGRLMQVEFDGHPYLFVNSRFAGKYVPPAQAQGRWINYGGDKIWPMPEGNQDEKHWVLESSAIDDEPYDFKVFIEKEKCRLELTGPVDAQTGLQYSRGISLDADTPAIHFHAVMRNATAHAMEWSVQSVSQYNLASAKNQGSFNKDFWAYTKTNNTSAYLDGYHVRTGLADDPAFHVHNNMFQMHWTYYSSEVWIDSPDGWLAVADGESEYGMIERFHFDRTAAYPGNATVIFYRNGPSVAFDDAGNPAFHVQGAESEPYYMEAEINSPLVTLEAGSSYALDTTWFPTRTKPGILRVTEAGSVISRLSATTSQQAIKLHGDFSVVVAGKLQLRQFDSQGKEMQRIALESVDPRQMVHLDREIPLNSKVSRVSLHLLDDRGTDWGVIDDAEIEMK